MAFQSRLFNPPRDYGFIFFATPSPVSQSTRMRTAIYLLRHSESSSAHTHPFITALPSLIDCTQKQVLTCSVCTLLQNKESTGPDSKSRSLIARFSTPRTSEARMWKELTSVVLRVDSVSTTQPTRDFQNLQHDRLSAAQPGT